MKNKYRLTGDVCVIELGKGIETLIDAASFGVANSIDGTWTAYFDQSANNYYCKTSYKDAVGNWKTCRLSRKIIGCHDRQLVVDHINHNTLDNTKINLRAVTHKENSRNQIKPHAINKCGFMGVCKVKNKFMAQMSDGAKHVYIGTFVTPEEAHTAYKKYKNGLENAILI